MNGNNSAGENYSTQQQERTTQLRSRNEQLNSAAGKDTTPLANMNETTQLVSRNETTQLCTSVDRLQPPTPAYNRLQPPAPPTPPAPPLQQNRLFLPPDMEFSSFAEASKTRRTLVVRLNFLQTAR
ncbi:hypothetical protein TNCV_4411651 [Trichonephila clavipes]|nr:hypothetical protein TNCV_4411651 [Trichonephila clavipes]